MKVCKVSMRGKDGETHAINVTASSLFNAVEQVMQDWSQAWWWDGSAVADVQAGGQTWRESLERVRQWRAGQRTRVGNA